MFKSLFSKLFKTIGSLNNSGSSKACLHVFLDEPEMPKSMIER
jgi:cyclic lactone autoinducer peptide